MLRDESRTLAVAAALQQRGVAIALHVVTGLLDALSGDERAACAVALRLTDDQRRGLRAPPSPLPLVEPIRAAFDGWTLSPEEGEVLRIAAVCASDRLRAVRACVPAASSLVLSSAGRGALEISGGRFRFRDERLRLWLLHTSRAADLRRVHARLSIAHARLGDPAHAAWHRAHADVEQNSAVVAPLLGQARRWVGGGDADRAYRWALEAARHAQGSSLPEARLLAGSAALGAGYVAEALVVLEPLETGPRGEAEWSTRALAGLFIARTHVHGVVPLLPQLRCRPPRPTPGLGQAWARAAAQAAGVCAERGERSALRQWLGEVREADVRGAAHGRIRDPVVTLCGLLGGDAVSAPDPGVGPVSGALIPALHSALAGDIDGGLGILARESAGGPRRPDPLVAGLERSPLVAAYLGVVEVLLLFWRGDIAGARHRLARAAIAGPVALPFAGLGAVLARRLDLAVRGRLGVLARSLTEALPPAARIDRLVDHGIEAYLAGAVEEAASDLRLWRERGGLGPVLAVPGLDEVGPLDPPVRIEPPEQARARELCRDLRRVSARAWRREQSGLRERARELRSPFLRGRVESLLGATAMIHGDGAAAARHLRAARSLFLDAGADAWRADVEARVTRLRQDAPRLPGARGAAEGEQLATCRAAWSEVLRPRELEVAMLVVAGAANREVAERLGVSVRTVEVHVGRVLAALQVRGRVELTALAHRTDQHV